MIARLTTDCETLQMAAFGGDGPKILARFLKESYEPMPKQPFSRSWSSIPSIDRPENTGPETPTCRLGAAGRPPLQAHRLRLRESSLKAIAALLAFNDEYRKTLVQQDVRVWVDYCLSAFFCLMRADGAVSVCICMKVCSSVSHHCCMY